MLVMPALAAIIPVSVTVVVPVPDMVPAVIAVMIVGFRKGKSAEKQRQAQNHY
jgi:hypothetical protein